MAKLIRRQAVVKRRDVEADRNFDGRVTMVEALEIVVRIYESEGYRDRTIIDYRRHWAEFCEIVEVKYIDTVTSDIVRGYITNLLKDRGLSPVTVNIRLSAIRAIFNRLLDEGIISESPLSKIRKLRIDEQKLFTLSDNQIKRLFSVIDKDSFAGFRDYCAMITMLYCGLRINEINALEITDIDFENNVMLLPGPKNKNRKTRAVPISTKVKNELLQLISETREYFGVVSHVFTNQFGEQLRDDLIRKRMDNYARAAGLKDECRASPHSLRHTFATNFLKNGGNIRALMVILGHSDISTTQIYLNYTDDQLIEQYNEVIEKDSFDI